jgi:thymidylate synthase (FAD)
VKVELLTITPDCEKIIERAGRTCYMSVDRSGAESASRFVRMLVGRGHHSVLEHATASFAISGVSRACTHQLVRHRLCSFSQKSQRYVSENDTGFVVPRSVAADEEAMKVFMGATSASHASYEKLVELGIPREDARFVIPGAVETDIVLSANLREFRHVVEVRGSRHAQWEIRELAVALLDILKQHAPNVFFDFEVGPDGCVTRTDSSRA